MSLSGFLDVVALGNLLELGEILDRRLYSGHIPPLEAQEYNVARWTYRRFQKWIASNLVVTVQGHTYSPFAIFRQSFAEFAAALITYKRKVEEKVNDIPRCTSLSIKIRIAELIKEDHPEILHLFLPLLAAKHHSLCWDGPDFQVRQRVPADDEQERYDLVALDSCEGLEVASSISDAGSGDESERPQTDTSFLSSPASDLESEEIDPNTRKRRASIGECHSSRLHMCLLAPLEANEDTPKRRRVILRV
jgi:hypothetical protein